jgi:hypothetical protein
MAKAPSARALWKRALCDAGVWRRACICGLPVGFLQALINQGEFWLQHRVTGIVAIKTVVTPLVTFSVALLSAAGFYVDRNRNHE